MSREVPRHTETDDPGTEEDGEQVRHHQWQSGRLVYRVKSFGQAFAKHLRDTIASDDRRKELTDVLPEVFHFLRARPVGDVVGDDSLTYGYDSLIYEGEVFGPERTRHLHHFIRTGPPDQSISDPPLQLWQNFLQFAKKRNDTKATQEACEWLDKAFAQQEQPPLDLRSRELLHYHLLQLRCSLAVPGYAPEVVFAACSDNFACAWRRCVLHRRERLLVSLDMSVYYLRGSPNGSAWKIVLEKTPPRTQQPVEPFWQNAGPGVREIFQSWFVRAFDSWRAWAAWVSQIQNPAAHHAGSEGAQDTHPHEFGIWIPLVEDGVYGADPASFEPVGVFLGWLLGFCPKPPGRLKRRLLLAISRAVPAAVAAFVADYQRAALIGRLVEEPPAESDDTIGYACRSLPQAAFWGLSRQSSEPSEAWVEWGTNWLEAAPAAGAAGEAKTASTRLYLLPLDKSDNPGDWRQYWRPGDTSVWQRFLERKRREVYEFLELVDRHLAQRRLGHVAGEVAARRVFAHEIRKVVGGLGGGWLIRPPDQLSLPAAWQPALPRGWMIAPFPDLVRRACHYIDLFAAREETPPDMENPGRSADEFRNRLRQYWELAQTASLVPSASRTTFFFNDSLDDVDGKIRRLQDLMSEADKWWNFAKSVCVKDEGGFWSFRAKWMDTTHRWRRCFLQLLTSYFRELMKWGDPTRSPYCITLSWRNFGESAIKVADIALERTLGAATLDDVSPEGQELILASFNSESDGVGRKGRAFLIGELGGRAQPPSCDGSRCAAGCYAEVQVIPPPPLASPRRERREQVHRF